MIQMTGVQIAEMQVLGMVKGGISLTQVLVGIHNAVFCGDLLVKEGATLTGEEVNKLFDGLDMAIDAARVMEAGIATGQCAEKV